MKKQSYENHVRYYAPHHFVFYPVISILIFSSAYFSFVSDDHLLWVFISLTLLMIAVLSFMTRQHYALTLQNRIVKLELRYRYFVLTGSNFEPFEKKLRDSQIFALRFSKDEELPDLVRRTVEDNLSAKAIKKAIRNWKGDYQRV